MEGVELPADIVSTSEKKPSNLPQIIQKEFEILPHESFLLHRIGKQIVKDLHINTKPFENDIISPEGREALEILHQILGTRMIDRGMLKALKTADGLKDVATIYRLDPNNPEHTEIFHYYEHLRPPLRVYHSGMKSWLRRLGFTPAFHIDMSNVYAANNADHIVGGDALLRDGCDAIMNVLKDFPGVILIRAGGDEFSIYSKDPSIDIVTIQDRIQQELKEKKALYLFDTDKVPEGSKKLFEDKEANKTLTFGEIKYEIKKTVPEPNRVLPENELSLEEQIEELDRTHPELRTVLYAVNKYKKELGEDANKIVSLLEDIFYDSTLAPTVLELKKEYVEKGVGDKLKHLRLYKDNYDFLSHLQANDSSYTLLRIELPGILKIINDNSTYQQGDEFIKRMFKDIVSSAVDRNIEDIHMIRLSGDFLIALPSNISSDMVHNFINSFKERCQREQQINDQSVMLLPVVTQTSLSLKQYAVSQDEKEFIPALEPLIENEVAYDRTRRDMGLEMQEKIFDELETLCMQPGAFANPAIVNLVTSYLDVHFKRGPLRLAKLLKGSPTYSLYFEQLKKFYEVTYDDHGKVKKSSFIPTSEHIQDLERIILEMFAVRNRIKLGTENIIDTSKATPLKSTFLQEFLPHTPIDVIVASGLSGTLYTIWNLLLRYLL
jgi:GGDEF domain-containing protein